jgi:hypothetical protein
MFRYLDQYLDGFEANVTPPQGPLLHRPRFDKFAFLEKQKYFRLRKFRIGVVIRAKSFTN